MSEIPKSQFQTEVEKHEFRNGAIVNNVGPSDSITIKFEKGTSTVNVKDLKEVASDQTYDTLSKIIEAQEDPEIKKQMRIKEIGFDPSVNTGGTETEQGKRAKKTNW